MEKQNAITFCLTKQKAEIHLFISVVYCNSLFLTYPLWWVLTSDGLALHSYSSSHKTVISICQHLCKAAVKLSNITIHRQ